MSLAQRALQAPPLPAGTCFHAQQAAEKALKAVAAGQGAREIPRTHSLLELADLIGELGEELPVSAVELVTLQPYAVEARYPGAGEPSVQAAKEAVALARRLLLWAEEMACP